jgi:hypothetical protein
MPKEKTVLVVIDAKELMYKRYSGKTCVLKVKAEAPMSASDVELLRVRPHDLLGAPEPESA